MIFHEPELLVHTQLVAMAKWQEVPNNKSKAHEKYRNSIEGSFSKVLCIGEMMRKP